MNACEPKPPVIRPAAEMDAEAISALIVPLVERYVAFAFEPAASSRLLDSMTGDAIARYIDEGYRYFVAERDDRIVGVVATRGDAHLYHLFVDESVQRQGIATALWITARDACIAAGHHGPFTVNASRYAEGFYRKLGFERVRSATQDGVTYIEMRLPFDGA